MSRRFVLCDRDGTINVERHYLSKPRELELLPGAAAGLRQLRLMGLGIAIVTNQSAIARGVFDEAQLGVIHERLLGMLGDEGVEVDGIYHCPHHPEDDCSCRKPRPGMIHQAATDLEFDPNEAFFIGDKACDIAAGQAAGATTFLVRTGYGQDYDEDGPEPDYVVDDLSAAAQIIQQIVTDAPQVASASSASSTPIQENAS